ncbi:hypothetical protein B0A80_20430 [Flavobacterium tructae]|nr:hypothetical protein B0A80_20430 [Flavobacterium tructae]
MIFHIINFEFQLALLQIGSSYYACGKRKKNDFFVFGIFENLFSQKFLRVFFFQKLLRYFNLHDFKIFVKKKVA